MTAVSPEAVEELADVVAADLDEYGLAVLSLGEVTRMGNWTTWGALELLADRDGRRVLVEVDRRRELLVLRAGSGLPGLQPRGTLK